LDWQILFKLGRTIIPVLLVEILYASIIFFIVWLITAFLKKKSSRWDYALWFLVLLRLMLPPNLSSPVSGRNLLFNSSVFESLFEYFIQTQYTSSVGFETFYSHLDDVLVKEGQEVKAGEIIGKVGTTGMSTGNHLHFEIRQNGEVQDPKNYIDFKELVRVNED